MEPVEKHEFRMDIVRQPLKMWRECRKIENTLSLESGKQEKDRFALRRRSSFSMFSRESGSGSGGTTLRQVLNIQDSEISHLFEDYGRAPGLTFSVSHTRLHYFGLTGAL